MKLLLIRHAEPDYTVDSLTPKGWVEAELLAKRLLRLPLGDLYQSPRGRAMDTARPYLRLSGKSIETLPWLEEFRARTKDPETGKPRICWDLKPRLWQAHPMLMSVETWDSDPLYAGSDTTQIWHETTDGVDALLARYGFYKDGPVWKCAENTEQTIACFCHFGIAMVIMGYMMNLSPVVLWQTMIMAPSSVTLLETEERVKGEVVWRCSKLGDLTHLEAAGEPWSTAGMYPELYTGIDSTDPRKNGTLR